MYLKRQLCSICLLASAAAAYGQQAEPLTYVALFRVEPGNTEAFVANGKQYEATLEKLRGEGVLTAYGIDVDVLHRPEVANVAFWYTAKNFAGLEKVEEAIEAFQAKSPELMKATAALTDLSKHRDLIVRSVEGNWANAGKCKTPVSVFNMSTVKEGRMGEYRAFYREAQKPVLDQLIKEGAVCSYSLDVEEFHALPLGTIWSIVVAPDMAALDKVDAAFEAASEKLSKSERDARAAKRRELLDMSKHEDSVSRAVVYRAN